MHRCCPRLDKRHNKRTQAQTFENLHPNQQKSAPLQKKKSSPINIQFLLLLASEANSIYHSNLAAP